MASYKVIQDIEAEDKLFGPLTLKQFIFAVLALASAFIAFRMAIIKIYYAIPLLPFIFVLGVLAAPLGRDQPTEVWILAKLRFWFKPRKRIWDQTGMQELVKITVPKKIEQNLTDNLDQEQVRSKLKALANTIDSRGWVIKNIGVNLYAQPAYGSLGATSDTSDRLINPASMPTPVPSLDISTADDIFENSTASRLDQQIEQSKQQHQQDAIKHMQDVIDTPSSPSNQPANSAWFTPMNSRTPSYNPTQATLPTAFAKPDIPDAKELALLNKLHAKKSHPDEAFRNHRKLQPLSENVPQAQPKSPGVTPTPPPDILNLAIENDRRVDSLAREAQKNHPEQSASDDGEVVISLH
jgi:hypothetical protein